VSEKGIGVRGNHRGEGLSVVIVVSRWNELVTEALLSGAIDELRQNEIETVEVVRVPGTWEIPIVISKLMCREPRPDAVIALGCILQGQTTHAQLLSADVSSSLMQLQVQTQIPIAWGILTPETMDQAMDRAGMKLGNKGREAALAVLETANLLRTL
jgi:6,7-dimethyl-8-ribityllumazine synthase